MDDYYVISRAPGFMNNGIEVLSCLRRGHVLFHASIEAYVITVVNAYAMEM